jgi:hypothetical protein
MEFLDEDSVHSLHLLDELGIALHYGVGAKPRNDGDSVGSAGVELAGVYWSG